VLHAARAEPQRHLWHFGSAEAVAHLRLLDPEADWASAGALVTHPRIAAAARTAGFLRIRLVEAGWQAVSEAVGRLESEPL
jgi:uroporphyrinogen-III synthase